MAILDHMGVMDLTKANIKSHLQKYRMKQAAKGEADGGNGASSGGGAGGGGGGGGGGSGGGRTPRKPSSISLGPHPTGSSSTSFGMERHHGAAVQMNHSRQLGIGGGGGIGDAGGSCSHSGGAAPRVVPLLSAKSQLEAVEAASRNAHVGITPGVPFGHGIPSLLLPPSLVLLPLTHPNTLALLPRH